MCARAFRKFFRKVIHSLTLVIAPLLAGFILGGCCGKNYPVPPYRYKGAVAVGNDP